MDQQKQKQKLSFEEVIKLAGGEDNFKNHKILEIYLQQYYSTYSNTFQLNSQEEVLLSIIKGLLEEANGLRETLEYIQESNKVRP